MTQLKLISLPQEDIYCELNGDIYDIAKMVCIAMIGSEDIAAIVLAAIPTFLDETNRDRASYCKEVMEAKGSKN